MMRTSPHQGVSHCVRPGCGGPLPVGSTAPAGNQLCAEHLDEERTEILLTELRAFADDSTLQFAQGTPGPTLPADDRPGTPPQDERTPEQRREQRETATAARRRAAAVLGAFGILAGVGGWASTTGVAHRLADGHILDADRPGDAPASWTRQARAVLDLTDRQLTLVTLTQARWNRDPRAATLGDTPAPISALLAHKAELEQRRAQLQSQLGPYDDAARLQGELTQLDRRLTDLTQQLAALPPNDPDPARQATRADLDHQLHIATTQRQATKQALEQLTPAVDRKPSTPLPSTGVDQTTALVNNVMNFTHSPNATPASGPSAPGTTGTPEKSIDKPAQPAATGGEGPASAALRSAVVGNDASKPDKGTGTPDLNRIPPISELTGPAPHRSGSGHKSGSSHGDSGTKDSRDSLATASDKRTAGNHETGSNDSVSKVLTPDKGSRKTRLSLSKSKYRGSGSSKSSSDRSGSGNDSGKHSGKSYGKSHTKSHSKHTSQNKYRSHSHDGGSKHGHNRGHSDSAHHSAKRD